MGHGHRVREAQDRLENDFEQLLAELSTSSTSTTSTTSTTTSTAAPSGSTTTIAGAIAPSTTTSTTTTTTTPPSPTFPDYSDIIERMEITEGEPIGFLGIPRLELGVYIVPGVGRDDLKQGVGHFPQTPMPGQLGNAAVAGHRTTFGHPFLEVDQLEVGDEIDVTMPYGGTFVYRVTSIEIVDPSDIGVIATTDPTVATLTLTTCHPAYSARQRLIIHAELDLDVSPPPGQPVINYGREEPFSSEADLPGEGPVSEPTTTVPATGTTTIAGQLPAPSSTVSPSTTSTTTFVGPSTTADPLIPVAPGGLVAGFPSGDDVSEGDGEAFNNRWFSDKEALPQVVLWAGSCTAIVVAAYQIAKRFRNSWIGLAVGIVPFVVGLYFFYENVNRLLPAAL